MLSFPVCGILIEKMEQMNAERQCKVCLTSQTNRVFQPCGHMVCCDICSKRLRNCPICRDKIKSLVIVVFHIPRRKVINAIDYGGILRKNEYFRMKTGE